MKMGMKMGITMTMRIVGIQVITIGQKKYYRQ